VQLQFNPSEVYSMSTSTPSSDNAQKGNDKSQRPGSGQQNQGGQQKPGQQDQGQRESGGGQQGGAPNRDKTGDSNRKEGSDK